MKKQLLLYMFIFFVCAAHAQTKDEQEIKSLLHAQEQQWNKGSIDGYMHGYWENDSLQFIGKSGPRYGYKTTLEKYKQGYPDAAHMGKLTFTVTQMKRLSPEYYYVTGLWALERSAGNISGVSTLLLRKIKGKWVIVSDHSS